MCGMFTSNDPRIPQIIGSHNTNPGLKAGDRALKPARMKCQI